MHSKTAMSGNQSVISTATRATVAMLLLVLGLSAEAAAQRRQGDRFGVRLGVWPQQEARQDLKSIYFNGPQDGGTDTLYQALVDEKGHILPFLEFYGMFNLRDIWWVEIGAGFSQRTDIQIAGDQVQPPLPPQDPKGDTVVGRILLGEGRIDFIPLFLGMRAVKDIGAVDRPHNIYGRGGLSMVIASDQPSVIHPRIGRSIYSEGTKAAPGFLLGAGGEYYFGPRFGILLDAGYRLSKLKYANKTFDMSGFWLSGGATIRVR